MQRGGLDDVVNAVTPPPESWQVTAAALIAAGVSAVSVAGLASGRRYLLSHFNVLGTLVHEGGHALITVLTGGGVYRFRITSPDSGVTHGWFPSKISTVLTGMAGYAMPPLAGLGVAALVHRGHAAAALALTVAATAILLIVARDWRTVVIVAGIGFVPFAVLAWAPALRTFLACTESWLLLTSELSGLGHLVAVRLRGTDVRDDASILAKETYIPGVVWIAGWLALILWGIGKAVPLLWG